MLYEVITPCRPVARDVRDQFACAPDRLAAVLDRDLRARLLGHRADHVRGGLSQLPPPLPGRLPERRALVPLRSDEVVGVDAAGQADPPRCPGI